MKEVFKHIITEFVERKIPDYTEREVQIPLNSKKIVSLIGARRTGKTTIILNTIKKLRETNKPQNMIYINFEDDRLFPLELKNLDDILEAYYELYPPSKDEKIYLFFDEVQNVKNWEKYIRRIYDTGRYFITITGSSSKLLSSEIATSLRGRSISYEVFPFSFREYLKHKRINVNFYSPDSRGKVKHLFNEYQKFGGFPEFIELSGMEFTKAVKEFNDLVVYKDIVERYNAENIYLLRNLIKYFFVNNSSMVSFSKLYNDFKSLGLNLSRNSIYEYASYLEDTFTLFFTSIFTDNLRVQNRNPRKVYLIDTSLRSLFSIKNDIGKNLENLVFLDLRRRTEQINYLMGEKETDFYLPMEKDFQIINVSYSMENNSTKKREIESLLEAMNTYKNKKALLLTNDEEEIIESGKNNIYVMPVWKWLLQ